MAPEPTEVTKDDLYAYLGGKSKCSSSEAADYIERQCAIRSSPIRQWYNDLERKLAAGPEDVDWLLLLSGDEEGLAEEIEAETDVPRPAKQDFTELRRDTRPNLKGMMAVTGLAASLLITFGLLVRLAGNLTHEEHILTTYAGEVSENNLGQIGTALRDLRDAQSAKAPKRFITDASGIPLLSWRVAILPHLGERDLYNEFRLDEPWDSEHNLKLVERMPSVFRSTVDSVRTTYLFPVGNHALYLQAADAADADKMDTILVVNSDPTRAVIWTKPEDWEYDETDPSRGLHVENGTSYVSLLDGTVQILEHPSDDQLRTLFKP